MPTSAKSGELELSALKHDAGAPPRVLAADDQEHILEALELLLRPHGYKVDKVRSPALVREYEETDFVATFRIPAGIDTAAITAETKNGTLVVRLPKAAAAKARKIVVRPRSGD